MGYQKRILLLPFDFRGILPKMLEAVKFPGLSFEDMHDHIAQIQKRPCGDLEPLFVPDPNIEFKQALFYAVGNRNHLPIRARGTNDKIIAEIDQLAHVEDDDAFCLLIVGQLSDDLGSFSCR